MATPITYAQAKAAVAAANLPTSPGSAWQGIDDGSYDLYAAAACYAAGVPFNRNASQYGFAFDGEMPAPIKGAIKGASYSATLAGSPLTGAHPTSVTWTLTETNGPADSYLWDFGDGNTATTTVANASHSYAAAGSFTAKCTPSFSGVADTQVVAAAPAVIS